MLGVPRYEKGGRRVTATAPFRSLFRDGIAQNVTLTAFDIEAVMAVPLIRTAWNVK